jgi:hypothetical protein
MPLDAPEYSRANSFFLAVQLDAIRYSAERAPQNAPPLVSRVGNALNMCCEGVEDLVGGLVPYEGFWVLVPVFGPVSDRVLERRAMGVRRRDRPPPHALPAPRRLMRHKTNRAA